MSDLWRQLWGWAKESPFTQILFIAAISLAIPLFIWFLPRILQFVNCVLFCWP